VKNWDFKRNPRIIVNGLGLREKWEEIMVVTHRYPLNGPFNQFMIADYCGVSSGAAMNSNSFWKSIRDKQQRKC
jgi:hypothetical protein